jgi:Calcineurin-like phosphoesterase
MNLKRRKFLFLSSFTTVGMVILGCTQVIKASKNSTDQIKKQPISTSSKEKLLFRFVSVADTGTGAKGQYAVAKAMTNYHSKNPYNLVVLAGDNIYNNGEIEKISAVFERPYAELFQKGVKFQACLGNHDIRTDNGDPQLKYAGFNMKGRYYTYTRNQAQFFVLDTNGNSDIKTQLVWLEQELSKSTAPWKIVYGHHPIYASGHYGSNPEFIKVFTPIFKKHNVQLYINGHEHHYERTKVINGTTYLICGAGAGTRPVGKNKWTAYSAETLSFAAYDVYADRIEIKAIGTNDQVFDRGTIPLKSI